MSPILELEEVVENRHQTPKLLVEWSSRWEEFVACIKPALSRSEARLAGEAPFGLIPFRIMIPSYVMEAILILSAIFIRVKIDQLRPYVVPTLSSHDVIYYSGDELPRTEDVGGAESGRTGEAGGQEAHHRTQTIKVARGGSLVPKVVDAPNLKLPSSSDAVANLLAVRTDPGPPPDAGLRSSRTTPNLATTLIAPSPDVIRDYTRNGVRLDPVLPPAPAVTRNQPLTAPNLNTAVVPPAPIVNSDHTLVAPALAPAVIPPSPTVSRDRPLATPALDPSVAAPAKNVQRDPFRPPPTMAANVVPPAPVAVSRQPSSAPVQAMDPAVVPPPVSAPERGSVRNPKVSLPAPVAVAPPPSADVAADMRHLNRGSAPDPGKAVVPPPPSPSSNSSFVSGLIGRIFGPSEVVAPPPTSVNAKGTGNASRPTLNENVAAPPVSVTTTDSGGNPRGNRNGAGTTLGANVVAPPPSAGMDGGTGTSRAAAPYIGNASVVAPPPALAGTGGGIAKTGGTAGAGGRLLADNVAPPPPSIGGSANGSGSGLGRKGLGLGAPSDVGLAPSAPTKGGSGKDAGTVISSQPGTKIGVPPDPKTGSLAMSPAGGDKPGVGGNGGGTGIGHGNGPGSGMNGSGPGAGNTGTGRGSDPNAKGGISPANGPGGTGTIPAGTPAVRGVDISGGSNVVTLPSFGDDPSGNDPATPGRSSLKQNKRTLGVEVVANAGAGGAFESYKKLLAGENHITYIETSIGTVVMLYADQSETNHTFAAKLNAPDPLQNDLPEGLPHARLVLTCTLDKSGNVKNPRVLEGGSAQMIAKVLASLRNWKFQPAMRNNQPVEVTAILGFGIDTNDRF